MSVKVFVDTNVLIYAKDQSSLSKQKAAETWLAALWQANAGVISEQSLREYYNATCNKAPRPDIRREVIALRAWLPQDGGHDRLQDAWALQDRFQLAFFDSMLLAAARAAGCAYFLSEDMQHDMDVGGTRIVSFLKRTPADILQSGQRT